jgi:putative nucleotidyltransferase with HDIG domain
MVVSPLDHEMLLKAAYQLPPLPQTVSRLSEIFSDPDYALHDVTRAIQLDSTLTARMLRAANSSLYGSVSVGSVADAVVLLGAGAIKTMALSAAARPQSGLDLTAFGLTTDSYWKHCVTVLCFAEVLTRHRPDTFQEDLATVALLHDFGKLILSQFISKEQAESVFYLQPETPRDRIETAVLGVSHPEVTAVVCQHWNLPEHIARAVQYHHAPEGFDDPLTHGLNISNQLAWQLDGQTENSEREAESRYRSLVAVGMFQEDWERALTEGEARLDATLSVYA